MKPTWNSLTFWGCCLLANALSVQTGYGQIKAQDLLPPVRGGSTEIAQPEAIQVAEHVVQAASVQDAANAAVVENIKQLEAAPAASSDTPEIGAHWIEFPSGAGIVATGASVYVTMPNPTATRMAQRNAYVIAYTKAKSAMSQQLGETSSEGRTLLKSMATSTNTAEQLTAMSTDQLEEKIRQTAMTLLKGYVTYAVQEVVDADHPETRTVYVSLVSTPATQKTVIRNGCVQTVDQLLTGIQNTLDEVQQQIVPPVGGRVIIVPETGETAFIAFGSAVVQSSPNPAFQARMKLEAQKIAALRARDALVGMLQGDKVLWASGISSVGMTEFEQTLEYTKTDPLNADETAVAEQIEKMNQVFFDSGAFQETVSSVRRGTLPPGIQEKSWLDDKNTWATTIVVYYPKMSKAVQDFSKSMRAAELIPSSQTASPSVVPAPEKPAPPARQVDGTVKPLPGGKINSPGDL